MALKSHFPFGSLWSAAWWLTNALNLPPPPRCWPWLSQSSSVYENLSIQAPDSSAFASPNTFPAEMSTSAFTLCWVAFFTILRVLAFIASVESLSTSTKSACASIFAMLSLDTMSKALL